MRVVIKNGDAEVELSDAACYNPTVMADLCDKAHDLYERAFDDEDDQADQSTEP